MNRTGHLVLAAVVGSIAPALAQAAEPPVDFQRDIRPILSNACFQCHGPDEKNRKADFRLDSKASAFAERDGSLALVPGKPQQSELYRRLTAEPGKRMPPAKSGKALTPAQIELVRKWIEQGAKWSEHWAFVAPVRPKIPLTPAPLPQGERGEIGPWAFLLHKNPLSLDLQFPLRE
jgi:mono/diheme cytochrome c family protein